MKASFAGGVLHSTDYFSSRDCEEGRAWLVLCGTDWHVLLPRLPASRHTVAHARPVTDCHELGRWLIMACGTGKLFDKLNHFLTKLALVPLR